LTADLVRLGLSPARAVSPAFGATRTEAWPDKRWLILFPGTDADASWKVGDFREISGHLTGPIALVSIGDVYSRVFVVLAKRRKL
jgi:hypothetical protein